MRSRSSGVDHDAAVARRLELLTSELATVRDGSPDPVEAWSGHGPRRLRAVPDARYADGAPEDEEESDEVDPSPAWFAPVARASDSLQVPSPPVARMPGRHASRRTAAPAAWTALVPEPLRGRVWLGPGQIVVVAVVAVVGLVATCWFLLRSSPHEVAAPIAVQTPTAGLADPAAPAAASAPTDPTGAAGSSASGGASSAGASEVVVDVTGKVRRPGIAVLKPGDRIVDAIRAAGGARRGVDLSALNLAQVVTDGQQIVVGGPAPPSGVETATGASPTATLVNLNTADQTALESLPEVGPVTAAAIIAWRTEHGGFSAVSQLLDVDGIGDAMLT